MFGVDVEPAASVEAEADEMLRADVVARQRQRHQEGLAVQREEQLAAVRVVVGVPQHHALGVVGRGRACSGGWA